MIITVKLPKKGKRIDDIYIKLTKLEYFKKSHPKSTGRELFNFDLLQNYNLEQYKPERCN
jgi:1,6-anhydro-N-acetylmuramate kinase